MPVVWSDRKPAKLKEHEIPQRGGRNKFLVGRSNPHRFQANLGSIIGNLNKNAKATGIFNFLQLETGHSGARPLATMDVGLVRELGSTLIYCKALTSGAHFHMQVKKVKFPNIKDRRVLRVLKRYRYECVASILQKHGSYTHAFINYNAPHFVEDDEVEFKKLKTSSVEIYRKRSINAPRSVFKLYKFGIKFTPGKN